MKSEDYVFNHDYGYGREPELKELNKLTLRNLEDLKVYVDDFIKTQIVGNYENGVLKLKSQKDKRQIIIKVV